VCLIGAITTGWAIQSDVVDLSYELNNETVSWPTHTPFTLIVRHKGLYHAGLKEDDDNFWFEINDFTTSEHTGTHMDAPGHFGRDRWSVNEIPANHFIGPVSLVDLRAKVKDNVDYEITAKDLQQWEFEQGTRLRPLVILWTGWASHWPNKERYLGTSTNDTSLCHFPGLHPDAAQWLVDNRRIHGVGIDTVSIDYGQSRRFMSHRILAEKNIFMLENLNTNALNATAFLDPLLVVSPLKITTGSGSPVRPLLFNTSSVSSNDANSPSLQPKHFYFIAISWMVVVIVFSALTDC